MLAVIALVSALYVAFGLLIYRKGGTWINPMTLILAYYAFNYPIRAALVLYFPEAYNKLSFEESDIFAGLLYSTAYVLIFVGVYLALLRAGRVKFIHPEIGSYDIDNHFLRVITLLAFVSGAIIIGFEVAGGRAFSLGQDIEDLRRPLWVNLVGVFYTLKWAALCLAVLLFARSKSLVAAVSIVLMLLIIVAEGVLSTGKGFVVTLLLLFLFVDCFLTGRTMRLPVVVIASFLTFAISSYSYYARYYLGFGGESEGGFGALVSFLSSGELLDGATEQIEAVVDRGTYYLDGLALMIRDGIAVSPGPYTMGSAIEILNIIPRAAGIVNDQYSFDRHVTDAVWGSWGFSQIFIGRIGESYFVLGPFGLIYAVINAVIFAFVAIQWKKAVRSLPGVALYFAVLVSWLVQDASVFYQAKVLVYLLASYVIAQYVASATRFGAERRVASA